MTKLFKRIGAFFMTASILLGVLPAVALPVLGAPEVQAEDNKYYFFDSRIVDKAQNAQLKIGQVEKSTTQATWLDQYAWTVDSDIPDWEQRVSILYPHVEYDSETGKYQMWYEALYTASPTAGFDWRTNLIDAANSHNVALGDFTNNAKGTIYEGKDVLCYMESTDGVNWTRPDCGEFYYKTQEGEIIGTNIVYVGTHGNGVERNEHPDPNEPKFLMAGRAYEVGPDSYAGNEPVGVAISWSEDGIHWEAPVTIKCSYECADDINYIRADTHNQLKYSPELGRYIVITRGYAAYEGSARQVIYLEAKDSLTSIRDMAKVKENTPENYWEATSEYWTDAEDTLDLNVAIGAQPYSMPSIHVADGYYIGVVSMADFANDQKGVWNQVHAELTWSPDGINWYYMDKGTPFIKNAESFAYEYGNDYGMIYCAAPVEVGDEVQIYYAALPELHYTTYAHIPAEIKSAVAEKVPNAAKAQSFTRTTALNVATIGKDRYAGYAAENGIVTTNAFAVNGDTLRLTADVAQGGSVKVAVLNSAGQVIEGYGFDDFTAVTESVTDKAVSWGAKNLSDLIGQTVSFQIQLTNATVYTISGNIENLAVVDLIPAEKELEITKGKTAQLEITVISTGDYQVKYTSDNENIAKVDSTGVVTGVSAGTANIVASIENSACSVTIPVTVTEEAAFLWAEDFESGLDKWMVRDDGGSVWTDTAPYTYISLTEKAYAGNQGFGLQKSGAQNLIRKTFDEQMNKVMSVWFYDDLSSTETRVMACMESNDGSNYRLALGVYSKTSETHYSMWIDKSTYKATDVERTTGWHQFVWDARSGTHVDVYIDGKLVASDANHDHIGQITLGWWTKSVGTTNAFDDVMIGDSLPWEVKVSFKEDFEGNLDAWMVRDDGGSVWTDTAPYTYISLTEKAYTGNQGFGLQKSGAQNLIRKTFDEQMNKVMSVWFYDDLSSTETRVMACMESNDGSNYRLALGVYSKTSKTHYSMWIDKSTYKATAVERTTGWHQFVWDATSGTHIDLYIDGKLVASDADHNHIGQITLGWWTKSVGTTNAFDNVLITDKLHWECADNNQDHNCDACGSKLTNCVDENNDSKCDICGKELAHVHDLKQVEAVEATCNEAGNSAYWTCSGCGKYYADAEAKSEIEKDSWTLNALGHSFTKYESDKNATCTEDGTKTAKCDRCDAKDTVKDEGTAGHGLIKVDEVPATKEAAGVKAHWSCAACGKLYADAEGKDETTLEALTIPQISDIPQTGDNSSIVMMIAVAIVAATSVTALVITKKRYF